MGMGVCHDPGLACGKETGRALYGIPAESPIKVNALFAYDGSRNLGCENPRARCDDIAYVLLRLAHSGIEENGGDSLIATASADALRLRS